MPCTLDGDGAAYPASWPLSRSGIRRRLATLAAAKPAADEPDPASALNNPVESPGRHRPARRVWAPASIAKTEAATVGGAGEAETLRTPSGHRTAFCVASGSANGTRSRMPL